MSRSIRSSRGWLGSRLGSSAVPTLSQMRYGWGAPFHAPVRKKQVLPLRFVQNESAAESMNLLTIIVALGRSPAGLPGLRWGRASLLLIRISRRATLSGLCRFSSFEEVHASFSCNCDVDVAVFVEVFGNELRACACGSVH
jgi:hypothetical protein